MRAAELPPRLPVAPEHDDADDEAGECGDERHDTAGGQAADPDVVVAAQDGQVELVRDGADVGPAAAAAVGELEHLARAEGDVELVARGIVEVALGDGHLV